MSRDSDRATRGIEDRGRNSAVAIDGLTKHFGKRVAGLADVLFEHDGQITKREVRAVTLSSLAPRRGDVTRGFAEADRVFEDTFTTGKVIHATFEPMVSVARLSRTRLPPLAIRVSLPPQ